MSQYSYGFPVEHPQSFQQYFDPSYQSQSSSNANVPFAGPPPALQIPQLSIPLPPQPPIPPTSLPYNPFLAPLSSTLPTSQLAILHPLIPPPPPQFLQSPPYPVDHRTVSSHLTASFLAHDGRLQPHSRPPPPLGPPMLPPVSHAQRSLPHESTGFAGAHDFFVRPPPISLPPRFSTLPTPQPPIPPTSLPYDCYPAFSYPQPPILPTSQLAILPHTISPPPPKPPQSLPRPTGRRMIQSDFAVSVPNYSAPPKPPPQLPRPPPSSRPTRPPLLPPASRAPIPHPRKPTSFSGAHDFIIKDSQFIDISAGRPGLEKLLKHSMPDAFHNSAARYPPPKCHLGTRNDYITKITNWALGSSHHHEPILWMHGPFGVGKSAVAQSCAEAIQLQNKLAAALFFSRSNTDRDDPRRVFTSIAYQIATICPPFRDIVDARIHNDPALALKSLSTQFRELLVYPLQQMDIAENKFEGLVVIIDGLDECRGTSEQCEIINIIATSARNRTTPFRWFITSRPEEPIIRTMNADDTSPVSFHFELPVSRKIDHEVLIYLTDEFAKIRKRHRLPGSWPSEEALTLLVDRAAGLWIYITTIIRFITDENGFGPQDQLRIVLNFVKDVSATVRPDNPLMEMDSFYTLIMERVPIKIRIMVRKILLAYSATNLDPGPVASAVGLSEVQFRHSCASIQSLVKLRGSGFAYTHFHFYHTSFLDFMKDPKRSKELCIYGNFLKEYRQECLEWMHRVCSRSTDPSHITFPSPPVLFRGWSRDSYYRYKLRCFWCLFGIPNHPIELQTAVSLEKLQFKTMLQLLDGCDGFIKFQCLNRFRDNLPTDFRDKIIRKGKCPAPGCTNTEYVWILGNGENEAVARRDWRGNLTLRNNQDPQPGWCFCGYPISDLQGVLKTTSGTISRRAITLTALR